MLSAPPTAPQPSSSSDQRSRCNPLRHPSPGLPLLQPATEARQPHLLSVPNSCTSLHLYLSPSCCCRLSLGLWHHPLTVPPILPSHSSVGPCMAASTIFLKMPFPFLKIITVSQCSGNKNAHSTCGQQDPTRSPRASLSHLLLDHMSPCFLSFSLFSLNMPFLGLPDICPSACNA